MDELFEHTNSSPSKLILGTGFTVNGISTKTELQVVPEIVLVTTARMVLEIVLNVFGNGLVIGLLAKSNNGFPELSK